MTAVWPFDDTEIALILKPEKPIKCKHCGKDKGSHLAKTFHCPMGRKIRNFGYSYFSNTTVFEPKPGRK